MSPGTDGRSIIVVDDHAIFRMGVAQAIRAVGLFEIVGEGSSAADAIALATKLNPDVVLLDISMPGGGLDAARQIRQQLPDVKVVILTVSEEDHDVLNAVEAGVSGYILKGVSVDQLAHILGRVVEGETYVPPNLGIKLLNALRVGDERPGEGIDKRMSSLSPRERLTLRFIAEGLSNREIAEAMGVQTKTVKFHVSNLFQKLGIRNRVEAAMLAHQKQIRLEAK